MTIDVPRDAREVYLNERGEPIAYAPYEAVALGDVPRAALFDHERAALMRLGRRALDRGLPPDEFVLVVIDVDDPGWAWLAEVLMPGSGPQWDVIRARGEKPVARGSVLREGVHTLLAKACGAAAQDLANRTGTPVNLPVVVFANGGATVFSLDPTAASAE